MISRPVKVAGMTAWVCTYKFNGTRLSVTLYATDPDQIEQDFQSLGMVVEGRLLEVFDA